MSYKCVRRADLVLFIINRYKYTLVRNLLSYEMGELMKSVVQEANSHEAQYVCLSTLTSSYML